MANQPVSHDDGPEPPPSSRELLRLRDQLRRQAQALRVVEDRLDTVDAATARPYLDDVTVDGYEHRIASLSAERAAWMSQVEAAQAAASAAEAGRRAAEQEAAALRADLDACRLELAATRATLGALAGRALRTAGRQLARRIRRQEG